MDCWGEKEKPKHQDGQVDLDWGGVSTGGSRLTRECLDYTGWTDGCSRQETIHSWGLS